MKQFTDTRELAERVKKFWVLASDKVLNIENEYDSSKGSPVYTWRGKYTTRGWTEWTQGFQFGIPLLIYEATGQPEMLKIGKLNTISKMTHHLSHFGVHDHGFNTISTYGNLLRLANKGKFAASDEEKNIYRLAIALSGSVQAKRWSVTREGGYIYSFNGPHSLFIDTMRTCRILLAANRLDHRMLEEGDKEINLLDRAIVHGITTAKYAIFYGEGRDRYDVRGRTAHESVFNMNDGNYRCPNSQQGFSGFTTWTRGLAWAMLGFSEFLEFLDATQNDYQGLEQVKDIFLEAARATCDFYITHSASDGIPFWDTGAPLLYKLENYQEKESDPYNGIEPVDSSAAAIGAQGLIRLGKYLEKKDSEASAAYTHAGLKIVNTLLSPKYLSLEKWHQGILLHSIYHHPNGWDYIPEGMSIPCGESSMWGDYHMAELILTVQSLMNGDQYNFFAHLK